MSQIAITFHFPSSSTSASGSGSSNPSNHSLSKRKISLNNRILSNPYITIDSTSSRKSKSAVPLPPAQTSPPATSTTSSSSTSSSSAGLTIPTGSKRRKGPVYVIPPSNVKLASLTPLLKPIIARCSTSALASEDPSSSSRYSYFPSRKRSKKSTPVSVSPFLHPYSKASDLSNTRSNIPSPREIERSKKLEEEKIRLKKENAATARANAIAKRKSNRKTTNNTTAAATGTNSRAGSRLPPSRRGSMENSTTTSKPTSPDEKGDSANLPLITTQAASEDGSSPLLGGRSNGLKRTRSQGVLPISTSTNTTVSSSGSGSVVGSPIIGSPLKAVMSREAEDDLGPRKKSKLSNEGSEPKIRRANTHSPIGTPSDLPQDLLDDDKLSKTVPLSHGQVLPPKYPRALSQTPSTTFNDGSLNSNVIRRSVSNSGRSGSVGSVGSTSDSGRVKRETQIPERLRDYEMKAVV